MTTVHLPRSLVALLPDVPRTVTIEAATVGELVDGLEARFPGMRDRLCEPGPRVRPFINIKACSVPARYSTEFAPGDRMRRMKSILNGFSSSPLAPSLD